MISDPHSCLLTEQNGKFQHGNYNQYYGYRNPGQQEDIRIPFLKAILPTYSALPEHFTLFVGILYSDFGLDPDILKMKC